VDCGLGRRGLKTAGLRDLVVSIVLLIIGIYLQQELIAKRL